MSKVIIISDALIPFLNFDDFINSVKANGNDLFTDLPLDEKEITIAPFSAKAVLSE